MTERQQLLESIATTTADYRAGDLATPTPEHVDRWIRQFDKAVQVPMLREIDHVFKQTYLKKELASGFFSNLVKNKKLSGNSPCEYWAKAHFLNIQQNGHSQQEILKLFSEKLAEQCHINTSDCGKKGGDYIYLDDVMFSGNRIGNDLSEWISNHAPAKATIHVVVIAIHAGGEYQVGKRLKQAIQDSGKSIEIHYWRAVNIENRKYYKNNSEVLWPATIPDDDLVAEYVAQPHKFPFEPRSPGGKLGPFSSEEGRQLLESELLKAGVKIRGLSHHPKDVMRPFGFSPFGLGFGSMIVTYRNCPNNCPLALWWGDPDATSGPFHWYPLFPRKTYNQEINLDDILDL